jgi:hypothetical protein
MSSGQLMRDPPGRPEALDLLLAVSWRARMGLSLDSNSLRLPDNDPVVC